MKTQPVCRSGGGTKLSNLKSLTKRESYLALSKASVSFVHFDAALGIAEAAGFAVLADA